MELDCQKASCKVHLLEDIKDIKPKLRWHWWVTTHLPSHILGLFSGSCKRPAFCF